MHAIAHLVLAIVLSPPVVASASQPSDCPALAPASAIFAIVDDQHHALAGANLFFTASNWDSTLIQRSDTSGRVEVLCVPAGDGYDVTVISPGYGIAHVSASASDDPQPVRIVLRRAAGRYVRVMHEGYAVPGVSVRITDSGGTPIIRETDQQGFAHYATLEGEREAVIEVSIAGFVSQRASLSRDVKNGPVLFEMSLAPACTPMEYVQFVASEKATHVVLQRREQ